MIRIINDTSRFSILN